MYRPRRRFANACSCLERALSDERVALFDIGPTLAEQKASVGMVRLPLARTLRVALCG